ncbi:NAD-binding Rossmann fold oxidoreductase [Agrocybe pediades]|nr:NAD-binding Rossmann fold oxidoreductase [Agrocybe pediades]
MSNPPIKVGFVGLSDKGWAATALAPSLLHPRLQGAYDLVAVSTTSEASAQASAEKYSKDFGHPIKTYYGDSAKIASDPEVNLVAISVKAPYHKQVVLPVIEAKKDFFLEWPAGVTTEDTKAIAEAARKQGVRSIIGLQGRHSVAVTKVKELIASGAIGAVKSTNVLAHLGRDTLYWPPIVSEAKNAEYVHEKKNGASRLRIPIAHQLDQLTFLLGDFISVSATDALFYPVGTVVDADGKPTGRTVQTDVPEHYSITGFLKSGILVNAFWRGGYAAGEGTGRRQYIWEIDGEEGTIRLESNASLAAFPALVEPDLYLNGKKVDLATQGNAVESISVAWMEFANGKGDYATIEDAVKHSELLDAIDRSAREGRRINL